VSRVKPLWYVDADTLGLAHVLIRARPDVTFPGDDGERHKKSWRLPPCVITDPATHDDIWIPSVAQAGMGIITRDKHIAMRTAEINEVIRSGARMFAIASAEQLTIWDQLCIVVEQWEHLERAAQEDGPYIYALTRTSMSKIDLEAARRGALLHGRRLAQ
jgi:PIN like domain